MSWWEGLGRKGANQAADDGIEIAHVARDGSTAALLDVVDGVRRLFEHVPDDALVRHADMEAGEGAVSDDLLAAAAARATVGRLDLTGLA